MQTKALLVTLFIALATALPSPTDDQADIVQGIEKNAFADPGE
jgi:hypothetical protein